MSLRESARNANVRPPGTAEYLDAVEACRKLEFNPSSEIGRTMEGGVLWKYDRRPSRDGGL